MKVYTLKTGSYEGVELVDIFESHEAAQMHAEELGLVPSSADGGYYIEEVEVKT